ncbi:MAG: peptidoglycan DD-metalloendopeptidase family protein [Clostridia bacterium]|nr:peptidoglycan DD-metalloendopeptidase family protein [Clostridia bacterium]
MAIKKTFTAFLALILCVTSVFVFVPTNQVEAAVDTSKEAETALKDKISALQKEQKELKAKLEAAENNIEEQQNKKQYLDSLISSTESEIETATQLIAEYESKIVTKNAEIEAMEADIEDNYNDMMGRLRFSYEQGNASYLELILNSDNMADFLSNTDRVQSIMDFDKALMDELTAQLNLLENERTVLTNTLQEQKDLEKSLSDKKVDLEDQKKKADQYITQLQADEKTYAAEYEKAKKAEKEANNQIEKLLAERQKSENQQYWGGDFIWPVPKNITRISSYFGWRILWGRSDYHLGIDIPAAAGTDIYASNGGTVVTATWHYSYGYYVLIDHGGGFATLYAHNSRLLVKAGDVVEQGDVIAKMGTTGSSSGNHLHFEVRKNGKVQNPLNYVKRPG